MKNVADALIARLREQFDPLAWGRFRHATTHAMAEYLKERNP